MPLAWFLCPYKRDLSVPGLRIRYCAMNDFTAAIRTDGGAWSETEVLGNRAIVKVRASVATLATIAATPTFRRFLKDALDDPLSSLTNGQKTAIRNELLDAGYTTAEVNARFPGGVGAFTLRQVLAFLATRRRKPRYDKATDTILFDGLVQACRPLADVDGAVT